MAQPPKRPAPQRGPKPQSTRGDFTGRQKEVLLAENEAAVEARREELGITAEQTQQIRNEGVINLMDGVPKLDGTDELIDMAAREPQILIPDAPVPAEGTKLGGGRATIDVYELPEEKPQAAIQPGEAWTPEKLNEPVLIRAEYDLEEVTIGYGNDFNFKQGYKYRVPRWVAMHLEEKGLATVLSLTAA